MTGPARARYLSESIATASPARLLVMLCDRLQLDLAQAEAALRAGNRLEASPKLMNAQDIVMEFRATLDIDAWEGAQGLADIYTFVMGELMQANIKADAQKVAECRLVMEPLCDAWREAALLTAPEK